jgi:hypothetical protein
MQNPNVTTDTYLRAMVARDRIEPRTSQISSSAATQVVVLLGTIRIDGATTGIHTGAQERTSFKAKKKEGVQALLIRGFRT